MPLFRAKMAPGDVLELDKRRKVAPEILAQRHICIRNVRKFSLLLSVLRNLKAVNKFPVELFVILFFFEEKFGMFD